MGIGGFGGESRHQGLGDGTAHNTLADEVTGPDAETGSSQRAELEQLKGLLNNKLLHVEGATPMNTQNREDGAGDSD